MCLENFPVHNFKALASGGGSYFIASYRRRPENVEATRWSESSTFDEGRLI